MRGPNNAFVLRRIDAARPSAARTFQPVTGAYKTGPDAVEQAGWTVDQITDFALDKLGPKKLDEGVDFFFEGGQGQSVHGFVVRPPGFSERDKKKWPVILFIHGGPQVKRVYRVLDPKLTTPQSAWEDNWSNRWNPNSTL